MSDFHSLFRESLDKRKLTIYRLSKELQIDRSTLYQVQNGGRLPTAQVFRRMASYLNLSSREEKQWLEAWKRERLGPNHYYLRRKVEVCVRMLDKYTYERTAVDEPLVWEEQITQTVCAEGKSKAAILLKKLLRAYLLSGDLAILDVHLPLPFFSRCCTGIPWMAGKRSGICVRQLLPLKGQEQEDAVPALEALDGVFGIFFLPREGLEYTPYFYYGEEARESGSLFPYYVVMNGGLFLLSTDQERAMYLPDPQAAAAYRTQFEKALRWASPLFRCYHSPVLAMDDTFGGTQEDRVTVITGNLVHGLWDGEVKETTTSSQETVTVYTTFENGEGVPTGEIENLLDGSMHPQYGLNENGEAVTGVGGYDDSHGKPGLMWSQIFSDEMDVLNASLSYYLNKNEESGHLLYITN